jgi:hypothetical protein
MPIRRLRLLPALLALALFAGCQQESISTYRVPRIEQSPPRLLGAIVPVGDNVWFLKLVGPAPAIAAREKEFDQFVRSLRFSDDAKSPLTWTTPEGWQEIAEGPAKGLGAQTRFATFRVGPDALKLTISRLGREAGDILPNVNRWRKNDLNLPPIDEAGLAGATRTVNVAGHTLTVVDMTGGANEPAPTPAPTPRAAGETLAYDVPPGWQQAAPTAISIAAFKAPAGAQTVDVTITRLGGEAGGLAANVNRWRSQIGLPPTDTAQLEKEATMLDSKAGRVAIVDLIGPQKRTLAGVLVHGGQSWFVKMIGPSDAVGSQKAAFEAFLKSLRFEAGAK